MESRVLVSSDGRRTYTVDSVPQIDRALSEVRALLRNAEVKGSARMALSWDADELLDRRLALTTARV